MSYSSRSASRRNGRKMLRVASRKSASRRRTKTTEDIIKNAIFEIIIQLIFSLFIGYWGICLILS